MIGLLGLIGLTVDAIRLLDPLVIPWFDFRETKPLTKFAFDRSSKGGVENAQILG